MNVTDMQHQLDRLVGVDRIEQQLVEVSGQREGCYECSITVP